MSDQSYKNQALSRFTEAAVLSEAMRVLDLRAGAACPKGMDSNIHAQRNALLQLSARLIQAQISDNIELGIYEWYRAHDKEPPPSASATVGSGSTEGSDGSV